MPAGDYRAARAKLRLAKTELARLAGVSVPTIIKVESDEGHDSARPKTIALIRGALEHAGATFGEDDVFVEPQPTARAPADPFGISATRFRIARRITCLEFRDLTKMTGLTYPTLKAVERGIGPPRVARDTLLKVVRAYRTVGYWFCTNPTADHLDRDMPAARTQRLQSP